MLDVTDDVLRLFTLDAIADQRSSQDRIFTQVFEGAAITRFAGDVHAAAKRHVVALRAEFAPNKSAVFTGCLWVPARRRAQVGRQCGRITAILGAAANAVGSITHLNDRDSEARHAEHESGAAVAEIGIRPRLAPSGHTVAMKEVDFLVKREFFKDQLRALIGRKA